MTDELVVAKRTATIGQ